MASQAIINANQTNTLKKTMLAIGKRIDKGETTRNSKKLAAMFDRVYGTNMVKAYHTK